MESKILERICGESIFIILALIIYFFISNTNNYKKIKKYLISYVIILTILSYLFRPFCTIDLTNLQEHVKLYYNYSWSTMFELLLTTTDYTRIFYFYIINRLGDVNLLQTFVTTIVYTIVFYTIYDYSKSKNYDGNCVARTVFLFMMCGQYIDLISGIRSTTAFALFYFCIYRELIKNKSILSNLFIYFLAIGFHVSVVPAVIIRILFLVFQKEKNLLKKFINIFLFMGIIYICINYGITILEAVVIKANIYLNKNIYSSINGYIISTFNLFILIYMFLINYKENSVLDVKDVKSLDYSKFCIPFFMIIIIFSFEYSIFHRYIILLSMIMLPIIVSSFNYLYLERKNKKRFVITKRNMIYGILLILMSVFSFTTGDMKLLQFFN